MDNYFCAFTAISASGVCFEYWLNRYQTGLVGIAAAFIALLTVYVAWQQYRLLRKQIEISDRQEVTVTDLKKITVAQAKTEARSALHAILQFTDPGVGKLLRFPRNGPIEDVTPSLSDDDLMARVAIGYPEHVEAFQALLDEIARYKVTVEALPSAMKSAGDGEMLWMPNEPPPAEAEPYLAAINALYAAAGPVRNQFHQPD